MNGHFALHESLDH